MAQIYRIKNAQGIDDIYDATTGVKISSPEELRLKYSGAQEVKPPIQRDGAGFGVGTQPPAPISELDSWKGYQSLKEAAQKILEMKTNQNKDLTDATTMWRGIQSDTSTFGGARDASSPAGLTTFNDKDFQLMSPGDQASVRLSRESAAQSHLQGIEQERQYREKVGGTALSNVKDIYDMQTRAVNDKRNYDLDKWYKEQTLAANKSKEALDAIKDRVSLGMGLTVADYKSLGVKLGDIKIDGLTADDMVNALKFTEGAGGNYNAKGGSAETGVFQYQPATWSGYSAEYVRAHPEEYANTNQSIGALGMTPENQEKVTKWKIQTWLDANHTPTEIFAKWNTGSFEGWEAKRGTNSYGVKYDAPAYVEKGMNYLIQQKGVGVKKNNYTELNLNDLAKKTGIDVTDLRNLSTDELNKLSVEAKPDANLTLANSTDGVKIQSLYGITAEDIADVLTMKAQGGTKIADYKAWLVTQGKDPAFVDEVLKLNTPKSDTSNPFAPVAGVTD